MVNYKLVNCSVDYWDFVRILRNDPRNAHGFIKPGDVTQEQQTAYMMDHHQDYKICLSGTTPVGFVGDVDGDIRVCVDHDHKNKGIATFMVKDYVKQRQGLFAKVKIDNEASLNLFLKCGFKHKYFILEPDDASKSV
jgi:RimJ/RimL family protein N-acetyltransferase